MTIRRALGLVGPLLAVLAAGCEPPDNQDSGEAEVTYLTSAATAALPFSDAVRVGDLLVLSGAIGADSTGALVAGGIGPETRQALENIRATLARAGSSLDRVVKCTAMLADIGEWDAMNQVYVRFFPGAKPARSAFAASGLVLGARIELECWAAAGD